MSRESIPAVLKKTAEKILNSTDVLNARTRDWQTIKNFISNRVAEIKLTDTQQKKMERYQYIYNLSVSGKYTESDILSTLMKEYKIERTQAYEDLSCSKEIFSSVININKQFELNVQLQVNRKFQMKAEAVGDLKALAAFEKNRIALLAIIEEQEENPADMFEGHQYEAVFNPALIGAAPIDINELMNVVNEKRKVKIKRELFEHLDFEDIPHENSDPQ